MDYDRLLDNLKHRGFLPQLLPDAAAARQAALDILGHAQRGLWRQRDRAAAGAL